MKTFEPIALPKHLLSAISGPEETRPRPPIELYDGAIQQISAVDLTSLVWITGGLALITIALAAITVVQFLRRSVVQPPVKVADPVAKSDSSCLPLSHADALSNELNRRYWAVQIAAMEHALAKHGYQFGESIDEEVALPLEVRLIVADHIMRERKSWLFPRLSAAEIAKDVQLDADSGYSLTLMDELVLCSRQLNRYIQYHNALHDQFGEANTFTEPLALRS
ncbi:hypothetical protein RAS12_30875 (plasmid) [Achromobacter seleniivolatilans]|uniref:DUF4129 domain-containing protein n=1 Tax=Achromobacter seleniivolatilans TaxID=3047478 RepID=A0ABY9MAM7_9BURK|nr:hypothetical protein [Achromobacter sp. R39]WMD24038.1 hypothetical protein RAS12_30875 [Achromobacter sp. R39]